MRTDKFVTFHELKTWPRYFDEVERGTKTFEIRKDDRGFEVGDVLVLREFSVDEGQNGYLGYGRRTIMRRIVYLLRGAFGLEDGYVLMAIVQLDPSEVLRVDPQAGPILRG